MMDKTATDPKMGNNRKVFIKTYGCQMNVYDSQRMGDALGGEGYATTQDINEADLVLLNTCHIREKAAEKLYSDLGRLREMQKRCRKNGQKLTIGVTGCVAQAEGEEILRRAPVVDLVVGPQTYHRLPQILRRVADGDKVVDTDYAVEDKFEKLPLPKTQAIARRGVSAFLTVQEGCNKFCTFCVVPYTRGAEISRPVLEIVREAQNLVAAGVREITLLGQNVNGWHGVGDKGDDWRLGDLLFHLAKIDGLARLRYTTSHPRDMDDSLLAAHRDLDILMPYLHLPVQSGSDRILKAMNRQHKVADYIKLIKRIRQVRSDIALSGDFIVGFPGESDQDFNDTMQLVREVFYASSYSFKYSPRPGTPGAKMQNHVNEAVKNERLQQLQQLLTSQQHEFLRSKIGSNSELLVERKGRHHGQMIGRSPWLLPVVVETKNPIGTLMPVTIKAASTNSFVAQETPIE